MRLFVRELNVNREAICGHVLQCLSPWISVIPWKCNGKVLTAGTCKRANPWEANETIMIGGRASELARGNSLRVSLFTFPRACTACTKNFPEEFFRLKICDGCEVNARYSFVTEVIYISDARVFHCWRMSREGLNGALSRDWTLKWRWSMTVSN